MTGIGELPKFPSRAEALWPRIRAWAEVHDAILLAAMESGQLVLADGDRIVCSSGSIPLRDVRWRYDTARRCCGGEGEDLDPRWT